MHDCQLLPAELSVILVSCQAVQIIASSESARLDNNWGRHVAHVSQNYCIMIRFLLSSCC